MKNIFERLLVTVRKYVVNNSLQLLYEQPSTGIHNPFLKIENSSQIPEKSIQNEVLGAGSFYTGSTKGKVPWIQSCPLICSPFVSSIFFSKSALKIFLIFLHKFRGQYGTNNNLNKIFQKILNFPKIRKKWSSMRFFGIFSKTALRIFLIFCQNVKLNSVFQPAKTVCEKKIVQKLFQVKDAPMIFFFIFYILLKNAWI